LLKINFFIPKEFYIFTILKESRMKAKINLTNNLPASVKLPQGFGDSFLRGFLFEAGFYI